MSTAHAEEALRLGKRKPGLGTKKRSVLVVRASIIKPSAARAWKIGNERNGNQPTDAAGVLANGFRREN